MDPIHLDKGQPYRLTGRGQFAGVTAEGEFEGQFGPALVFRNLDKNPVHGFRTAWLIEWKDLENLDVVKGQWKIQEEE